MTPPSEPTPSAPALRKRRLGRTGLLVTEIGVGGANLTAEQGEETLLSAFALGVNFVETGRAYKGSEYLIGGALAQSSNRAEVHVASKTLARTRDGALSDLERSLQHLRLQTIDIYQLNSVGREDWPLVIGEGGALGGLKEARDQGLLRFIGISSHSLIVLRWAIETGEFDTIQARWGAFHTNSTSLLRLARERGVGVIGMKPFGGLGMFGSLKGTEFERTLSAATLLRFALANDDLSVCIPGVRQPNEVRENVRTASLPRPGESERARIADRTATFLNAMASRK